MTPFSTFHATNTDTARLPWRKRNRSIDTATAAAEAAEEAATVYRATGRSVSLVYAIHSTCLCICASWLCVAFSVNVATVHTVYETQKTQLVMITHTKAFAMLNAKCSIWWIISEKQSFTTEWFNEFRDDSNDTLSFWLRQLWVSLATADFWLMSFSRHFSFVHFSLEHLTISMHLSSCTATSNGVCVVVFFVFGCFLISFSLLLIVSVFVVSDDLSALSGIFHAMSVFFVLMIFVYKKIKFIALGFVRCGAMSLGGKWQLKRKWWNVKNTRRKEREKRKIQ